MCSVLVLAFKNRTYYLLHFPSPYSHFNAPFLIMYANPTSKRAMNKNISISPCNFSSMKFTAHGYMNITSTSNKTNKIATKKYLIEKGMRALPCDSMPHSKVSNFTFDFLLGPRRWVTKMVVPTNPTAAINCSKTGK